jgi:3-deoxy-D-manno-octulosonate 8-phosphate phosphatase (KDO 8-P phosphatase)
MSDSCLPGQPGAYPSDCDVREAYRTMARERQQTSGLAREHQVVLEKAKDIKILLLDVDGVMTDGTLLYSSSGEESKSFNTQDGFGLRLLQEAGIEAGLITARSSEAVGRRARELRLSYVYQGAGNKLEAFQEILRVSACRPFEIAYMGDDWLDLGLLSRVGLALAPANAVQAVREAVHYVTCLPGGGGAVREVCDLLLAGKGLTTELLQRYMSR